ncbi:MAG: NADH-ubiquinone oxidoreductase-F iron-sulfur binding region domain-containing protein [Bacteroidota bacterium]
MENNIQFFKETVLQNETLIFSKEVEERLKILKHEITKKAVIYVGASTCGYVAGAQKIIDAISEYISTKKIQAEVVKVGCIGICAMEPIMDVQLPGMTRVSFKKMCVESVATVLDGIFNNTIINENVLGQYRQKNLQKWEAVNYMDEIDFFAGQKRIVLELNGIIDPENIEAFIAHGGYRAFAKTIYHYTSTEVCKIIEKSELRGRGGSGFSCGKKWKIAHDNASDQRYLICNANESDPGAYLEKSIIESNPHKLIEGMAIAAYAIGASKAYIYIKADNSLAIERFRKALDQAKTYGLLGENIFDSGFNLEFIIKKGPGAFICGEETALLSSIEGKRGMPRFRPPFPAERGLFGKPTIINNVETLCNIPSIILNGPVWFSSFGTQTSKGTKVFTLSGKITFNGIIEVEMGKSFEDIIYKIGKGIKNNKNLKAIQLGGPAGTCLVKENMSTAVDYEELKAIDAIMGSGSIIVMDEESCMVDITKFYINFMQHESCGKCIPCREGTQRMFEILEKITKIPKDEVSHQTLERFKGVMQLESIAEVIKDTSLCGLGKTAANTFLSSLKWFRDEYEEHIFDRKCKAGVCKELRSFIIDTDACTGCNICMRKCPENAIIGTIKYPHFIVESKCTGCGICFESCKFSAIIIK